MNISLKYLLELFFVPFCLPKKVPKKGPRKRYTTRFREGAMFSSSTTVASTYVILFLELKHFNNIVRCSLFRTFYQFSLKRLSPECFRDFAKGGIRTQRSVVRKERVQRGRENDPPRDGAVKG